MKTILVPLDLSPVAVRVCNAACELAKLAGARPILLHIVQPPPLMMSDIYAFDASQLGVLSAAAEKNAGHKLRALARHCAKQQVRVTTVQRPGVAVTAILAKARSTGARYIVMGSHGHGAMYDLLVGSTTHGVLKQAPCPVLIVPAARPRPRPRG